MFATPIPAFAAWSCGIDGSLLPGVAGLDVVDGQLQVHVGQYRPASISGPFIANTLVLGDDGDWTVGKAAEMPTSSAKTCMNPPPDEALRKRFGKDLPAMSSFEQNIEVCADGPGRRWGGISFYSGEGMWGVGGIVEQDTATGATRYFRPRPLADVSVSHLEYFGNRLWIGTETEGECGQGVIQFVESTTGTPKKDYCLKNSLSSLSEAWTLTLIGFLTITSSIR